MYTVLGFVFIGIGVLAAVAIVATVAQDIRKAPQFVPGPFDFDFDDHAEEAISLLGDDFSLWEKELSKR